MKVHWIRVSLHKDADAVKHFLRGAAPMVQHDGLVQGVLCGQEALADVPCTGKQTLSRQAGLRLAQTHGERGDASKSQRATCRT